jgi:hypothetical protein
MFKGVSGCIPAGSILYFGWFNPFLSCPFSFSSHSYSTAFNIYHYILYFTGVMFYDIVDALSLQ